MKKFTLTLFFTLFVFSFHVYSAVKTWDGGGADNNWSTAANWVGDVAPVPGDDLVFPAAAIKFTANNNFFLLTPFRSVKIEGSDYTIGGNAFSLTDGFVVESGTQAVNTIINLSAPQTFFAGRNSLTVIGVLFLSNNALTFDGEGGLAVGLISGNGAITKNGLGGVLIAAASGYGGAITHNNGIFVVDADIPNSSVTINAETVAGFDFGIGLSGFGGTGRVGAVSVTRGTISAGTLTSPTGVLNTGNLTFTPNGNYVAKIGGTAAGTNGYDQLNVTGSVVLNNARLVAVPFNNFRSSIGDSFTILNNDGADAIVGTFLNAPEGSTFAGALNTAFRITYRGGDGNDVVITRVNRAAFDFDGDGKADVSVFRPTNNVWYQLLSSNAGVSAAGFGLADDRLVPADYDGDNKTDIAVYRPSNGVWYVLRSSDSTVNFTSFGTSGDIPLPNDYDGDGRADYAVFRPSNGTWYQLGSLGNQFLARQFGQAGDAPQIGDFDRDGIGDLAVFRQGVWFLQQSSNGFSAVSFGLPTDKPVPADYDGDGKTDVAVYRSGVWYQLRSTEGFTAISFGVSTDRPVPADYDGDGKADVAVYRDGVWYILRSREGFTAVSFGLSSDRPIPGAFIQ
jgi:(2Fe-2S) ferredoxin